MVSVIIHVPSAFFAETQHVTGNRHGSDAYDAVSQLRAESEALVVVRDDRTLVG